MQKSIPHRLGNGSTVVGTPEELLFLFIYEKLRDLSYRNFSINKVISNNILYCLSLFPLLRFGKAENDTNVSFSDARSRTSVFLSYIHELCFKSPQNLIMIRGDVYLLLSHCDIKKRDVHHHWQYIQWWLLELSLNW